MSKVKENKEAEVFLPVEEMTTNKTFADRLLIAQREASGIGKDSNNAYHKYPYTDCDSMIDYGGRILNLAGLVLYPKECEHESRGNMTVVKKVFICETTEGEQRDVPIEVPVVSTDRKQADDKASFGSQSSGLAYLMRDLLLIPRGDKFVDIDGTPKSSVCSEDDTVYVKTIDAVDLSESREVLREEFAKNAEWSAESLGWANVDSVDDLSNDQITELMEKIEGGDS